ncbi:hypothetical protein D9M71_738670 [compost metagenome]
MRIMVVTFSLRINRQRMPVYKVQAAVIQPRDYFKLCPNLDSRRSLAARRGRSVRLASGGMLEGPWPGRVARQLHPGVIGVLLTAGTTLGNFRSGRWPGPDRPPVAGSRRGNGPAMAS